MADTDNTDRAQWKFNALYADTEVRSVADDKLLAVVHSGPEQARIVSLLKGASQPNAALADGWKLVPPQITDEMANAWQSAFGKQLQKRLNGRGRLKSAAPFKKSCEEVAYVAMLAAAPSTLNASKEGSHG